MTTQDNSIRLPPGRIVQGDLYEANTKNMQGETLVTKTGPNIGKPRVEYFFALAIPKAGEQIWWQTQWGAAVYALARAYWPQLFDAQGNCLHRNFAWKITDGDSTEPNPDAQMKRNCDREGFPGHWVIRLSSGYATKIYDAKGEPLLAAGLVKRGFWVEVLATINSNEQAQKPGIYMNHNMVAYRAPGQEISSGPDPRSVGFGVAPLPPGVTAQPIGPGANLPAAPPPPAAAAPPQYAPPPAAAAAVPVQPAQNFLYPPVAGAAPPLPQAPAHAPPPPPAAAVPSVVCPLGAPPGHKMVNLNGHRYDAFRGGGWTDAAMIQAGHMVRL